jgi:hypothetical protein
MKGYKIMEIQETPQTTTLTDEIEEASASSSTQETLLDGATEATPLYSRQLQQKNLIVRGTAA